ncbi:hypothetical protein [Microbacterium luticocti]|uniref:hypothetical protein n=1 Tax=Microbacterium luticocti TaxID=451764 RepID=UPI0012ECA089|nr:hypothetical protein [Microbacterium luticocti]
MSLKRKIAAFGAAVALAAGGLLVGAAPANAAGSCTYFSVSANAATATCKGTIHINWYCWSAPTIENDGAFQFGSEYKTRKITLCSWDSVTTWYYYT